MRPLESCQRAFTWFCIVYTDDESLSYWQNNERKMFRLIFAALLIGAMVLVVTSSVELVSTDLEQSFFGFFQLGIASMFLNAFIAMFTSGQKVATIFGRLAKIHEKCKNSISHKNTRSQI